MSRLTFRLDYSEDNGVTWLETTPVTFEVRKWDVKIPNELLVEHILDDGNEIKRFHASRVRLLLKIDVPNFYPTVDSDHATYVWLQKWTAKSPLRISFAGAAKIDGLDLWTSATNTNYVVCESELEADKHSDEWRSVDLVLDMARTL